MKINAYAKINLRLKCVGKNEQNYHLLNMVNAKINLYDELNIEEASENKVIFDIDELNHLKNNMCLNILNDMCDIYNIKKRYSIYIKKNIPQGAGLGGGSSDAAAIINYLNCDNKLNLDIKQLELFSLKYGADIPYCLHDGWCFVEGIGEKITPLDYSINQDVVVIYPNIFLSTAEVFKNNKKFSKCDNIENIKDNLNNFNKLLDNDLEESAFDLAPKLRQLKELLKKCGNILMSGSGSTIVLYNKCDIGEIKKYLNKVEIANYRIFETTIIK